MARGLGVTVRPVWLLLGLAACSPDDGGASGRRRPQPAGSATAVDIPVARPGRIPYLDFDAVEGCHVYWLEVATDTTSVRREVRCPREVVPGEKLRLAGRVCFRESPDAARRGPVRCAYQLMKIEEALRTGEGEWDLPPREED